MLRFACAAIQRIATHARSTGLLLNTITSRAFINSTTGHRGFSALSSAVQKFTNCNQSSKLLIDRDSIGYPACLNPTIITPTRTVTKYSLTKGKRKTVKAVVNRFMRLHWGIWIRPKVGRHNTLWRKTLANRNRLRQHVFCNAQQSYLFDKMVTRYWRKPRFYVDDPYEPYHTREEFNLTRKKPRPFP